MLRKQANAEKTADERLSEGSMMSAPQTRDSSINGQVVLSEAKKPENGQD